MKRNRILAWLTIALMVAVVARLGVVLAEAL